MFAFVILNLIVQY